MEVCCSSQHHHNCNTITHAHWWRIIDIIAGGSSYGSVSNRGMKNYAQTEAQPLPTNYILR